MHQHINFSTPSTPISWGELIDKITILEIKQQEIKNPQALRNVEHELHTLSEIASPVMREIAYTEQLTQLKLKLREINQNLWGVEDALRLIEETQKFDDRFIQLARSVYHLNDQRAKIKREINVFLSSEFVEEKSYRGFST